VALVAFASETPVVGFFSVLVVVFPHLKNALIFSTILITYLSYFKSKSSTAITR